MGSMDRLRLVEDSVVCNFLVLLTSTETEGKHAAACGGGEDMS